MRVIPLLAVLVACTGAPAGPGSDGADGSDGAGDADGVDGTEATDGADGDSGDPPAPTPVTGSVTAPAWAPLPDGLVVSAVPVIFGASGGPTLRAALDHAAVDTSGAFSLSLPAAPPDTTVAPLERDAERGALVALVVHDGPDPFVDGGAVIRGIDLSRLWVWLDAPSDDLGWPAGWSAVDTGLAGRYAGGTRCLLNTDQPLRWRADEGYPQLADDASPIAIPGVPAALSVAGDLTDPVPEADGVIGAWYAYFLGERGIGSAFDAPLSGGRYAADLVAEPPADAWLTSDPDWTYAAAFVVAYDDEDGDGAWQEGESLVDRSACLGDDLAILRYNRPVTTWRGYRFLDCYEARAGWSLATVADDETWTNWQDDELANHLDGTGACPLFGDE